MKSFATIILAALPLALADCPANGNNCARAVTGTRKAPDQASRSADCSSYMRATVTPKATTVTNTVATVTITVDAAMKRDLEARQQTVIPTAIPAYATEACSAAAYSSVCSCWGITATTTTAPTPTVTVTATATATVTGCPNPGSCNAFDVKPCPESANGCTCGKNADGGSVCWAVGSCSGEFCTKGSDCGAGKACILDTCCGNPGLCQVVAPGASCANPMAPRALFGRKVAEVVEEKRAEGCVASPANTC